MAGQTQYSARFRRLNHMLRLIRLPYRFGHQTDSQSHGHRISILMTTRSRPLLNDSIMTFCWSGTESRDARKGIAGINRGLHVLTLVSECNSDLSPVLEQERIGRRLLGSGVLVAHKSRPTRGKKKSRRRFKSA